MSEQALKQQIQNLKKHNARLVRLARDARSKLSAALDGTGLCLRAALTPFELDNGQARVGASIGIDDVQPPDDFVNALRRADRSMYQIKHTGKNGAVIGSTPISLSQGGTDL